jgi:signal transduction histidine kinase
MKVKLFNSLSVRLTLAFLLAAILGVALVAVLAYFTTSNVFDEFVQHAETLGHGWGGGGMLNSPAFLAAQEQFQTDTERNLWIAGAAGVALALLLGFFFTRQIVSPLDRVAAAARRVAGGDLKQRVEVMGSGELAELGNSFNAMSQSLEAGEQSRQRLIADIAHELRTPLTVIEGTVDGIADGVFKPDAEHLDSIKEQSALLTRLVNDLRDLSSAESGQLKLEKTPTDIVDLVKRGLAAAAVKAREKNIELNLKAADGIPEIEIDPVRIEQVVGNLLANAIRHTPEGGSINVSINTKETNLTLDVSDSGEGIPPEHLPHIFERFYRVGASRARSEGGTGLGLAIVKQMVEAHGGSVWAESQPGEGSTFHISLPL